MRTNYEQIVKAHQTQPGLSETRVSDETKFQVVRANINHYFNIYFLMKYSTVL